MSHLSNIPGFITDNSSPDPSPDPDSTLKPNLDLNSSPLLLPFSRINKLSEKDKEFLENKFKTPNIISFYLYNNKNPTRDSFKFIDKNNIKPNFEIEDIFIKNYFVLSRYNSFILYNSNSNNFKGFDNNYIIIPVAKTTFKNFFSGNSPSDILNHSESIILKKDDYQLNQYPGYTCEIKLENENNDILELEKSDFNTVIYNKMYNKNNTSEVELGIYNKDNKDKFKILNLILNLDGTCDLNLFDFKNEDKNLEIKIKDEDNLISVIIIRNKKLISIEKIKYQKKILNNHNTYFEYEEEKDAKFYHEEAMKSRSIRKKEEEEKKQQKRKKEEKEKKQQKRTAMSTFNDAMIRNREREKPQENLDFDPVSTNQLELHDVSLDTVKLHPYIKKTKYGSSGQKGAEKLRENIERENIEKLKNKKNTESSRASNYFPG